MKLKDLLKSIDVEFNKDIEIKGITSNSKEVKEGYLFLALKGSNVNGNDYIDEAIKNKASYVLSSEVSKDKVLKIDNLENIKAKLFYRFYNNPQDKLKIIGITGTNGKTTIAYLLYELLNKLKTKTMYIGTLGIYDNNYYLSTNNTTPDCELLAKEFSKCLKRKTKYVVMEVSSHSLAFNRVDNLQFIGGIYTNLTHEHLDYHKTMENYMLCKQKLFNSLSSEAFAIINKDDSYYSEMIKNCKAKISYYGYNSKEYLLSDISKSIEGISFSLNGVKITSKLLGLINIYNLSAVIITLINLGFDLESFKDKISELENVNGRLEKVYNNDFCVILDFAHTPDAMEKVLLEVKPLVKNKLVVLFGCGGNRDTTKRPIMGSIACKYADKVYVTSDNPRNEDPLVIIQDILKGCEVNNKIVVNPSREESLISAINSLEKGDILMVLGKGHEEYQIINNEYLSYSDKRTIKKCLHL